MNNNSISNSVINRLPRYYRFLGDLKAYTMARTTDLANTQKLNIYPNTRS